MNLDKISRNMLHEMRIVRKATRYQVPSPIRWWDVFCNMYKVTQVSHNKCPKKYLVSHEKYQIKCISLKITYIRYQVWIVCNHIVKTVGDHPNDGGWLSLGWWVTNLWMVSYPPGDDVSFGTLVTIFWMVDDHPQ